MLTNAGAAGEYPRGVSFDKEKKKFAARISRGGCRRRLGRFDTPQEAAAVYAKAKSRYVREIALEQADRRVRDGLLKHAALIEKAA